MLNSPSISGFQTVASGVNTIIGCSTTAVKHQIKMDKGTATAGTLTLTAKAASSPTGETVYDENLDAIVFNMATDTAKTYIFEGIFDSLVITCAGSNGTYTYCYSSW